MHVACRYGGPHKAVKLGRQLCAPRVSTRTSSWKRPFSVAPALRFDQQANLLGSYTPNAVPNQQARNIAILGGGISGLATAHNLLIDVPYAKITIYEEKERVGGWVDSEQVEVNDGSVLFEWGPRSLRPDVRGSGLATLLLMAQLGEGITKQIRSVSTRHPAAVNRYIYYPDHLARVPTPDPTRGFVGNLFNGVRTLLTEPMFKGVFGSILSEPTVECRSRDVSDSSVGEFISRRYGSAVADNLLSAMFHGIYAGDIYKLSAAALMPQLWYLETRSRDNSGINLEMVDIMFKAHSLNSYEKERFRHRAVNDKAAGSRAFLDLATQMSSKSVYSFVKGVGQLTDSLLEELTASENVTIKTSTKLQSLTFDPNHRKTLIHDGNGDEKQEFDYVVSSLSPAKLGKLIKAPSLQDKNTAMPTLPALYASPKTLKAVNVMVVNLYYKSPQLPILRGFGYLIPRSIPFEQNPERALGVIFASETAGPRGEDAVSTVRELDEAHIKRLKNAYEPASLDESSEQRLDRVQKLTSEIQDGDYFEKKVQVGQDTATGTKLAVMLGGHWWDDWSESDLPSEEDGIQMAKSVIARHLKITEEPLIAKARMQRDCIPQYPVGYRDQMGEIHRELFQNFSGRLKVLGPWWQGGVGVNDCVKSARETSRRIRESWDHETGLEDYERPPKWIIKDTRTGTQVMDPMQRS